jgi:DMSO/TMAO reductase YedYZ molybdopterin-dependent catalytic subunit
MIGVVSIAGLVILGAILLMGVDEPGWGLLYASSVSFVGCGVTWWLGTTDRWHQGQDERATTSR